MYIYLVEMIRSQSLMSNST